MYEELAMKLYQYTVLLICIFGPFIAAAEEFDGSQALICASSEAIDCVPGQACVIGDPETIGAPRFLRINFDKQEIIGTKRTSPILRMDKSEKNIQLYGNELDMGWVVSLDRLTGHFSTSLVNSGGAFVIFGICTPL
jgi:hypothetical protein